MLREIESKFALIATGLTKLDHIITQLEDKYWENQWLIGELHEQLANDH